MTPPSDFHFDYEWQDPCGAKGDELRATWASLSISVAAQSATELIDTRSKTVRKSVYLPLFPLAEWIADHWWFLLSEVANTATADSIDYDRRHNLRWAREGFALPSLRIVPLGKRMAIEWHPLDVPETQVRFLSAGEEILAAPVVIEGLRDFVEAVVGRLELSEITDTSLQQQWRAIANADQSERKFCLAAARLGIDPYAMDESLEESLFAVAADLRPELLLDFLAVTRPTNLRQQADALKFASEAIAEDTDTIDALAAVREKAPPIKEDENPWEVGYRFAMEFRKRLSGNAWKSRSLPELASHLQIDQLDHCLVTGAVEVPFLDGLVGSNRLQAPKFLIEKTRPDSRQFAFCRALFEHLTLPGGRFAAVSKLRTDRQQMNRAFAAEFLAPHQMLQNDVSAATIGEEEVADLASDYGVSPFVIRHQIENHGVARVAW